MNSDWPIVKLGEVLSRIKNGVIVQDDKQYTRLTIRMNGKGISRRDTIFGNSIGTKKQFIARAGQFVLSKIDARNGAFGLLPNDCDNAIITGNFWAFNIDKKRLLPKYFEYLTKTPIFADFCIRGSEGTTNRLYLRENKFLAQDIPLPPLAEQQRIVARIAELASQIEEARTLRKQAVEEAESTLISMAYRTDLNETEKHMEGWQKRQLRDCITLVDDSHKVSADRSYPNLGIYSYARGLFQKLPIVGIQTSAPTLRRVRAGQFIYSRLFAFEGAYGRVTEEYDGYYVSSEYPTFNCNTEIVRIEFLEAYFKSRSVWREVAVGSKGLGDRRQRVQPAQILAHSAWIPPLKWQDQIAKVSVLLDSLKTLHTETAAELDALLPALLDRAFKGEL